MDRITVFPYLGEFGWELFCWHGYLRSIAHKYKDMVVYCREGHELLYNDFATEIHIVNVKSREGNGWRSLTENFHLDIESGDILDPCNFDIGWHYEGTEIKDTETLFFKQDFKRYGTKGKGYDYLINARKRNDERDYHQWNKIIEKLNGSIGCVGNLEQSEHIEGTIDLRGMPLSSLADIMCSSGAIIGQSSGVIHFASLCGLRQIVWGREFERLKYLNYWNPFNVDVEFISSGWNPDPKQIIKKVNG